MEYDTITQDFLDKVIPSRKPETHKGDYGRVLALCGSRGYTGAAYFAAQASVLTGSGIVTLCIPEPVYPILAGKLNEPVVYPVNSDKNGRVTLFGAMEALRQVPNASAALVGCGLGNSTAVYEAVQYFISHCNCPLVIDADGINVLKGHIDVMRSAAAPIIVTPHLGELRRLLNHPEAGEEQAAQLACDMNIIVLLKGHRTIICAPNGTRYRNTTGNPGMAKGGSGDVLAGIILSLCGQGIPPLEAACAGAYLHGKAGDICANAHGEYGMTPTDMLSYIPTVLRRYNTREW